MAKRRNFSPEFEAKVTLAAILGDGNVAVATARSSAVPHLDNVSRIYPDLVFMRHDQALFMRDFIVEHDCKDILEIGFAHGKSSAYIAAALEDLGRGHLVTIDKGNARKRDPNIDTVLSTLGLSHRVTPIYAHRPFTWELAKMIQAEPRPQFDLCYFDGDHSWDGTGFGFLLVDMLLRSGGWIIFDDLKWTFRDSIRKSNKVPKRWKQSSEDEAAAAGVGMAFDLLVPHLGYTDLHTEQDGWWGIARKPVDRASAAPFQRRASIGRRVRQRIALRSRWRSLVGKG